MLVFCFWRAEWRYFAAGAVGIVATVPLVWQRLLDYQKERVLVFLNPERNPLGAGYHIIQSKIGIGSGGLFGKGFSEGTKVAQLSARKTHRFRVYHLCRNGLCRRRIIVGTVRTVAGAIGLHRQSDAQSVCSPRGWRYRVFPVCLYFHQFGDGDGAGTGGRRAIAVHLIWRHIDAHILLSIGVVLSRASVGLKCRAVKRWCLCLRPAERSACPFLQAYRDRRNRQYVCRL